MPVADFHYRQLVADPAPLLSASLAESEPVAAERGISPEAMSKSLAAERTAAVAETEVRLRQEYERKAAAETERITAAIAHFDDTRKVYFAKVESEVVRLALSIAAKILHRESQVDPLLVTAMVQIALGRLKDGASASLRVRPQHVERWTKQLAALNLSVTVNVVSDGDIADRDCILETELGSVNFNLDVQLQEVEKGFLDVLAQRPAL